MDEGDPRIVETIPLPGHRADDGPGLGPPSLTACSWDHAIEAIQASAPAFHGIEPIQRRLLPPHRVSFCAHCAWCGRIVARSDSCVLHPEACPYVAVERTVLITEAAAWIAVMFHAAGFQSYTPDSVFEMLVDEAATRFAFYQARGGNFLGAVVLRKAGIPYVNDDEPF
jgi:hypothetical protein